MARKSPQSEPRLEVSRRKFLAGVTVAGAATAVTPPVASAATQATSPSAAPAPRVPSALPPSMHVAAAETQTPKELTASRIGGVPGSDFMMDVIKTLDIKYCPSNCASSFRAIHESMINYGSNKMPEYLTCTHEESAVGMAHGYFKVAGKPLMTLCHGTVGLQHATMAVYNAWCDRVPVIIVGGNDLDDAALRTGGDLARRRAAARADPQQRRKTLHSALRSDLAAAGRLRRREGSGAIARQRAEPGDRRRSRRPQRERRAAPGAAGRGPAGAGDRSGRPDELPQNPLSQPSAHRGQQCRRHHRARALRLLGHGERLDRQRRARHRHQHHQNQA